MRDIKRSEIILWKCPTCGSRNKVFTILHDSVGNRIGSSLKCCNCGTLLKRLDDVTGTIKDESHDSFPGRQYCIKLHKCDKCKSCILNNKNSDNTDVKPDNHNCNCNCDTCPYKYTCKKQISNKLTIKVNDLPKFL